MTKQHTAAIAIPPQFWAKKGVAMLEALQAEVRACVVSVAHKQGGGGDPSRITVALNTQKSEQASLKQHYADNAKHSPWLTSLRQGHIRWSIKFNTTANASDTAYRQLSLRFEWD